MDQWEVRTKLQSSCTGRTGEIGFEMHWMIADSDEKRQRIGRALCEP